MGIKSDYNVDEVRPSRVSTDNLWADLNLSFAKHPGTQDIRPVTDIDAIKNAVKNLILTGRYERPFHPELGSGITDLLFENADQFTAIALRDEIHRVIEKHEPRVELTKVEVFDDPDRNSYAINIGFSVRSNGLATEVSFYLERIR